jgi:hypothetical protein
LGSAGGASASPNAAGPLGLADYLRARGRRLYSGGGILWRVNNHVLVPVNDVPVPVDLRKDEAARLLKESGAWLLRYPGPSSVDPTGWYYVACDNVPDIALLPPKVRYEVRTGLKRCVVRRSDPAWLAERGYSCYAAVVSRYGQQPLPPPKYRANVLATSNGPFEFWVVEVAGEVAAYTQCIMCGEWVDHNTVYYHPDHLRNHIACALVRTLQEEYVLRRRLTFLSGARTLLHDSNYNAFLLKLGFRQFHCELGVAYTTVTAVAVSATYPLRALLARLPKMPGVDAARAVLMLEEIRRTRSKLLAGED